MPQEPAKKGEMLEHSPVAQAKTRLQEALKHLESAVQTRLADAANMVPAANEDGGEWQAKCEALAEENAALSKRNAKLTDATESVARALDDTIAEVEKLLKE